MLLYFKREKARILFMFNDMYKRRKGYTRHIRHEVRRQIKKRTLYVNISVLVSLKCFVHVVFIVLGRWIYLYICIQCQSQLKRKSLMTSKGKPEAVKRRWTDNTRLKRKRTNSDLPNTTHKTKDRVT